MFYAFIFDFGLVGVVLSTLVFFIWCWMAFRRDRKLHPTYKEAKASTQHEHANVQSEKCCA